MECLDRIHSIVGRIGNSEKAGFSRQKPTEPELNKKEIYDIIPEARNKPYDTMEIIKRLVDKSVVEEYKSGYGKKIICGYAHIDGWSVGIVANQKMIEKSKKGELQKGGMIYDDSADKTDRSIMN